MDMNIGIKVVGIAMLQELWNKVALQAVELVSETRDVVLEKDSFQEFSRNIGELNTLFQALDWRKVEAAMGSERTKVALETLSSQLRIAREIIKDYKPSSRLRLLLHSHKVLLQMKNVAREIATAISSFQWVIIDMGMNFKTMTDQVINTLRSMEFQSAVATETIAKKIESLISQNDRNRENSIKLLQIIAEVVGGSANASMIQNELTLLKQEKEEMESQKKHAEALQLSQLIQLLYSTEIATMPQNEEASHQAYPIESFICPLCNEMMTDPVAIFCGHSFERVAVLEYFKRGYKNCPTCRLEIPSLELTPNVNLRNSIEEWKQRDMDLKFQAAIHEINSDDYCRQNKALGDMQDFMESSQYAVKVSEEGLIPKFVEFLRDSRLNTKAAVKCLYYLAKYCDGHKLQEDIVEAGAVRCIVKNFYKGKPEPDALAILLELSKRETLGEKIGNTKDCIPLLVSLLSNDNNEIAQKALNVLQNLSSNTHFAVKMAEAGHFQPFVTCFNLVHQSLCAGQQEARASMAAAFTKMQLRENSMKDLKDKQFIQFLIRMLSSNSPACKSACLKCIKKLIAYPEMVELFLSDRVTIPNLLGLISFIRSDPLLKQEAAEILALLIGACQHPQFQMYQGLQELQSRHNVNLFLQLMVSSDPQTKIQFLHLLLELSYKSQKAQSLIRSNEDAIAHLFSSLDGDQHAVRRWSMKLIHSVSEGNPAEVALRPSLGKEAAINTLAAILTSSPDIEERSTAAGIISQLPKDDIIIEEILRKSEVLKAIHEVICSTADEYDGIRVPANIDTSLLENALAILLHFTEPTKPDLQWQVGKLELYTSLVRVLSKGSSLAKQRTAIALAQLSERTSLSVSDTTATANRRKNRTPLVHIMKLLPNISCCFSASSENEILCSVHGAACSPRDTFCLIKVDAVRPLVRNLSETESGVVEASLMALETLLTDNSTISDATAAIVDSQGVVAILQVLDKGTLPAKTKALDLFQKMIKHTQIAGILFQRSESILIQLLHDDALRKKAALVLRNMNTIPEQSSYF
ncbi:U-box domain-containing protein [Cephalotus follicularis]|uniref:RING-type E3 ubiquitin transferase n=1 Tax=Cephalotus follicularis TaxID=3775 RepID=A0A1Q3CQR2_CEPFO|nr:U-box domain-containing protein [Cephalotus follicularis]